MCCNRGRSAFVVMILGALALPPSASAQPVVRSSTFDAHDEGWTAVALQASVGPDFCPDFSTIQPADLEFSPTDGDPGGYIRAPEVNGLTSYFRAPPSFHGDLSAAAGGSITLSRRYAEDGTPSLYYHSYEMVHIVGSAGTLVGNYPRPADRAWETRRIEFLRGFWLLGDCRGPVATEAQIAAVLANVSDIFIRAEHTTNIETNHLDSVTIRAPAPGVLPTATWTMTDDATPTARWGHAMAVDTDRNVLVLFGGNSGERDTWEFNLANDTWTRRQTNTPPSRRAGHAMVYDRGIGKIVLAGGSYLADRSDEVWEYDGQTATWTLAGHLPQPRTDLSMAYDTDRDTIVLYGGLDTGQPGATDVLERAAPSPEWVVRPTESVELGPQRGHAMAYDAARGLTVLVDSRSAATGVVGVHEWDGLAGSWTTRAFAQGPLPRLNPCLTYDAARKKIVLVGGEGRRNVWDYDGQAWTARALLPSNNSGKDEHAIAYDPFNQRVLNYGGFIGSANPTRYLSAFDGDANTWTFATTSATPTPRYLSAIAFDEVSQRTILWGGHLVHRGFVDQIATGGGAFDGQTWSSLTPATPDGDIGRRYDAPFIYDPFRNTMFLYGGMQSDTSNAQPVRDLWSLALNPLVWNDLTPLLSTPPGQRRKYAAAFDRARDQMVIYGGRTSNGVILGDTWLYSPASDTWTQAALAGPNPGLRTDAAMTYDEARGVIVLFGGRSGPTEETYPDSTWEWDGQQWTDVTPPFPRPTGRRSATLLYDSNRAVSVLIGGNYYHPDGGVRSYEDAPQIEDLWQYDGNSWSPVRQLGDELPIARWLANVAFDRARNQLFNFGGSAVRNDHYSSGQTWLATFSGRNPCPPDLNADGLVDFFDIQLFLNAFASHNPIADFNNDSLFDFFDVQSFLNAYAAGCP